MCNSVRNRNGRPARSRECRIISSPLRHPFFTRLQVKKEKEEYAQLLTTRKAEERERRSESQAKKRAARLASQASKS
jgi:hypothetical protein